MESGLETKSDYKPTATLMNIIEVTTSIHCLQMFLSNCCISDPALDNRGSVGLKIRNNDITNGGYNWVL